MGITATKLKSILGMTKGFRDEYDTLTGRIEAAEQELHNLATLPLTRDDAYAYLVECIDAGRGEYAANLSREIAILFERDPMTLQTHSPSELLKPWMFDAGHNFIAPVAIIGLFADVIKKAVKDHLESMPWPAPCGPPIAQRKKRQVELVKLVGVLQAEREELKTALRKQGIVLEDIPAEAEAEV